MASNETVAEIKYRIYSHWRGCENCSLDEMNGADLIAIADQFEAAHNREMNHRALIAGVSLADAVDDEHKRELAAKNREIELLEMALEISNGMNDAAAKMAVARKREIADIRRRLKVAEDALDSAWMYADKLPHQWPLPERVRTKMKNALAAIREKGGQDGK